ncbi:MAG: hydrogenase maturation protease [Desulfuromonadaceae bacterium]|nr:hydrogenase maturation protease [Desulfuromonadaceae bacterium]
MSTSDHCTIVICIGNELVADDAVGFEIFNRLAGCEARLEYCSVGGIDLLPMLEGETDLVVVDAVQLGALPGTIHVLPWDALPRDSSTISSHGLGLRETIEIGTTLYPGTMPEWITLVGIEGRCFNRTREFMTEAVQAAIDTAVTIIKELVARGH